MKKLLIVLVALMLALTGCGKNDDTPIGDYCCEQANDYTISDESSNAVTITVTAPDYAQLIQNILSEGSSANITIDALSEAISASPDSVKVYTFISNSSDEDDIKAAFTDQIAKELAIAAIRHTDSKEEWSDGQ